MAKKAEKRTRRKTRGKPGRSTLPWPRRLRRAVLRAASVAFLVLVGLVLLLRWVDPPTTHTIWSEQRRLGAVSREWVPLEAIAPGALRAVVAAEDANFCHHWGFDMAAIRAALEAGATRGASTISQQTVKNVFLWQGRSWTRKALETLLTPMVEVLWSKRRILEVYMNVAEFDEGVFGIAAASEHYFGLRPDALGAAQGARLAVLLPNPKGRDPAHLSPVLDSRARGVADGAATIAADGRAACFDG